MLVLGIETSCDETAAAIVRDGREIVSSIIASQIETHKRFGGVVPELASREHLDKIVPIVEEAFAQAKVGRELIDGIAVTVGPGLVGSLLVGVSYAKAMAFALNKPLVGVNHIEGHIYSVAFDNPPVAHPMTPPVKHSTKSRRCSAWVIRVDQSLKDWLAKETRAPFSFRSLAWVMADLISASAA